MITTIAIIAQPGPQIREIKAALDKRPGSFKTKEFLSLEDVGGLGQYPFDVLILRLLRFSSPQVPMILRVRARFPTAGIITISPEIDAAARFQMRDFPLHKLLAEPEEVGDLENIVEKLRGRDPNTKLRMHTRVRREGAVELVDADRNVRWRAQFVDFAQMGARVVVNVKTPIERNARLQLHYASSSDPSRIHRIETQVVWEKVVSGIVDTVLRGPQQVVGLRFIAVI